MLEARRPERYVFQWQAELGGTTVEVDFEEHSEGTVVRLREHGYPDTPEGWAGFRELLDRLGRSADAAQVLRRARRSLLADALSFVCLAALLGRFAARRR